MSIVIYGISAILVFVFSGLPHSRDRYDLSFDVRAAKFLKSCRAIIKLSWKSVIFAFIENAGKPWRKLNGRNCAPCLWKSVGRN
jgi:hypothetical protein